LSEIGRRETASDRREKIDRPCEAVPPDPGAPVRKKGLRKLAARGGFFFFPNFR
jgi:hypothetical protein